MPAPARKSSLFTTRTVLPVLIVVFALLIWLARSHASFDWRSLAHQLRAVSLPFVLLACTLSYSGYFLRAWRWSVLLAPLHKSSALELLPSQLIGFTLVGLFGRFADLGRPYLVARRTGTTVATQLAVYSIERAFDLASAAILFSTTLALAPHNMPHHQAFARAGAVSLAATLFLVTFALALRFAGEWIASTTQRVLHPLSPALATSTATHIRSFSHGLRIVSTLGEFLRALGISLAIWMVIALFYLVSAHAFLASPPLATLSFAATMLLLATGLGGSLVQLPVLGWFTQIAVYAAALHGFFGVPLETASACGAVLLVVGNIIVVPAGLIAARIQGISLRDAAQSSAEPSLSV
jgi:uncharacterized membrane protein YbhN (UPF0104 family)